MDDGPVHSHVVPDHLGSSRGQCVLGLPHESGRIHGVQLPHGMPSAGRDRQPPPGPGRVQIRLGGLLQLPSAGKGGIGRRSGLARRRSTHLADPHRRGSSACGGRHPGDAVRWVESRCLAGGRGLGGRSTRLAGMGWAGGDEPPASLSSLVQPFRSERTAHQQPGTVPLPFRQACVDTLRPLRRIHECMRSRLGHGWGLLPVDEETRRRSVASGGHWWGGEQSPVE
jgi:hypothetical protein